MGRPEHSPAERVVAEYFPHALTHESTDEMVAYASVNHGRWLVRCPWCKSAQYASREDHRFFCVECFNAPAGQRWVAVIWPQDHEEIESVLCGRPKQNRNWTTGEPVDKLREENRTHALEILGG